MEKAAWVGRTWAVAVQAKEEVLAVETWNVQMLLKYVLNLMMIPHEWTIGSLAWGQARSHTEMCSALALCC
jgi:hypothetical protein